MAQPEARSNTPVYIPQGDEQEIIVDVTDFLSGFIYDQDPSNIPDNALVQAEGVVFTRGRLFVRNGSFPHSITKPNSNKVLNIYEADHTVAGNCIFRFDREEIYLLRTTGWVQITPSGVPAISGSDLDYFSFVSGDDRIFFCNGVDPIREIDPVALTYIQLGNAPSYKYIIMAYDRLIGGNLHDIVDIPYQVGGSGRRNYSEWDSTIDISAFVTPIVNSGSDTSDAITGIFSSGSVLFAARERSIWFATHTSSASNPFTFVSVPGLEKIGANKPRAITFTNSYGLVWFNSINSEVYQLNTNTFEVKLLAEKLVSTYLDALTSGAAEVFAEYSSKTRTYSIYFKADLGPTYIPQYNFLYNNWAITSYGFSSDLSCATNLDFASSSVTIDDLPGTIDDLDGTIEELGGLVGLSTKFMGTDDGSIFLTIPFSGVGLDVNYLLNIAPPAAALSTDDGGSFSTKIGSKIYKLPMNDLNVVMCTFIFTAYTNGTIEILYLKEIDSGNSLISKKVVTITSTNRYRPITVHIKETYKIKDFQWFILSDGCVYSLNRFTLKATPSGVT